jgi:hypothetical protein
MNDDNVLASVLVTKCEKPNVHFLLYDKILETFHINKGVCSMKNYWCVPEAPLDIKELFDKRLDYMDQHYWRYKAKMLKDFIPVDVKYFGKENQIPLASEEAVLERNSMWEVLLGAPLPEESQRSKRQRQVAAVEPRASSISAAHEKRQSTSRKPTQPKAGTFVVRYMLVIL